ncbi:acetyltransferase, GNAT family [Paraglaciecola sp. T6c]|uniref:GNAT family N-acetyltransferase n=1 Tax=Pseudoalteromonas atlantica (strain T6c / ATCC BAA-1087) TaxID=3042615 RepID=UPI00005C581A|nr:GNAT family N-acetyltransferase [Paraglaciecola sp. T6c]ABG42001.1 acetyltransferase, GNAT family [Paraglaciecola sp. T6c]
MKIEYEEGSLSDILLVNAQIPEFDRHITQAKLQLRLNDRAHLLLVAKVNGGAVGYKLGYALSSRGFYSWLGAVVPAYRKMGIASSLRQQQEDWALKSGYEHIEVKSMNRYPAMLQLLIGSGYKIVGYEKNGDEKSGDVDEGKICFRKILCNL